MSSHLACLSRHCLASNEQKTGGNCSWHAFLSSILSSGISTLCLYGAILLCTKHMAGFPASSESSPSLEQMEFCGNFLSEWRFSGNLVWRTFSKNHLIFAKWESERSDIPHYLMTLGLCHKQITNQ
jgi:hypothetical protein